MNSSKQTVAESFWSAFRGIKHVMRERNFIVQIVAAVAVIALALALNLPRNDSIIIIILIAFVLASEAMNSACEQMLDFVTKEHNHEVARIKDILAGAVLIYSATAFVIGVWIFGNALLR